MNIEKEIEDRIIAAANALYEQNGRTAFPKVDAVRKEARANMNDVSETMKKWRVSQMAKPDPVVVVHVPQAISEANQAALVMLWQSAQELSNNALIAAQKGWDADRQAADQLRKEIADAVDVKVAELEAAQAQIKQLQASEAQSLSSHVQLQKDMDGLRLAMVAAESAAEQMALQMAAKHAAEVEQLKKSFEEERVRHQDAIQQLRDELIEQNNKFTDERDQLRAKIIHEQELAAAAEQQRELQHQGDDERISRAEELQKEAQQAASVAGEKAAELRGKVDAMQTQIADLFKIIALRQQPQGQDSSPVNLPTTGETQ